MNPAALIGRNAYLKKKLRDDFHMSECDLTHEKAGEGNRTPVSVVRAKFIS